MKSCNPISAKRWVDEALRRLGTGGDRSVIESELRIARGLLASCKTNLLGGAGPRRRARRRKRRR